jgi:hypothetical protein
VRNIRWTMTIASCLILSAAVPQDGAAMVCLNANRDHLITVAVVLSLAGGAPAAAQVIPAKTTITIRTVAPIDSDTADLTKEYDAALDEPLVIGGKTIAPRGTDAKLRVVEAQSAGKVKGRAALTLSLAAIIVDGRRVEFQNAEVTTKSGSQGERTTKGGVFGGLAGAGIGALAGGAQGAAIGAGVGAAAGVTAMALTGPKVHVPAESRLAFVVPADTPME